MFDEKIVEDIREKILGTFNDLTFVESTHQYFLHGEELDCVSHVTHKFGHPFDTELRAEKYAEKNGETKEYWMDKWRFNSLKATTSGTLVHEYGESLGWLRNGRPDKICDSCKIKYIKDKQWLVPTCKKEEAALKFYDELDPNLHFVLAETKVYSGSHENAVKLNTNYAGTFDLLMYYHHPTKEELRGLIIMDWKTNADLYKDFSRTNGKMLLDPFSDLYDESFGFYTLQLSCYQIPLEDIGLKVLARRIIWLKDDGTYQLIPTINVTDRLKKVL